MNNRMEIYFRCAHGLMDSEGQQKEEILKIYENLERQLEEAKKELKELKEQGE